MRTEPTKPRHGGTRQGAGRKAADGEPTKTVRVPQSLVPMVVGLLDERKRSPASASDAQALKPIVTLRTATLYRPSAATFALANPLQATTTRRTQVDLGRHLVRDPTAPSS